MIQLPSFAQLFAPGREAFAARARRQVAHAGALALLMGLLLAGAGCAKHAIPYFDAAPEAQLVAYDEQEAVRIESRRVLLDWVAKHPDDNATVLALAASEWSIGHQVQAVQVLDYLIDRIQMAAPAAPTTGSAATPAPAPAAPVTPPTAELCSVYMQKAQYLAWMAYTPGRQAAALVGQLQYRAWEKVSEPAQRADARVAAIAALDHALAIDPHYLDALQLRARIAFENQDWPLELDLCARWSEADPKDGRPWYDRGMALQRLSRYADALPMFQRAVELEPRQPDPWYGLALANMAAGSREAAQIAFEKVLDLAPNDADACFRLYQLYSEQPLTSERFKYLVRAATLSQHNLEFQQALVKTIRDEKINRPDLLMFALKNIMAVELASGTTIRLEPIKAYADEAARQNQPEEAFSALYLPLSLNRQFAEPHPELGLQLLQLADHWVDADTWHWNPPMVELLDPVHPLGAENIGRPVLYKQIMDRSIDLGAFLLTENDWSRFHRQGSIVEKPRDDLFNKREVLADQLTPDQQVDLRLLVARLSVARTEHLRRILIWQEVLKPEIPYSNRFQMAIQQNVSQWPDWWLTPRWNRIKKITVAGSIELKDETANNGLLYISDIDDAMATELNAGLSRDNYTDDSELQSAYFGAWGALGMLCKMRDPLLNGDTPANQARHREISYLIAALAPTLPLHAIRSFEQLQAYAGPVDAVMRQLPGLIQTEPAPRRRAVLSRLYWYWQLRNGNVEAVRAAVGRPAADTAFEATDAYACACRLWLRTIDREHGAATAITPAAAPQSVGTLRHDLEQMLAGLSTWQSVPSLKLRMQLSFAIGLALGDDDLATAAGEVLVRIEASTEQGQETNVLNLLAGVYELQGRAYPAMYCLRRSLARRAALQQSQVHDADTGGNLSGGSEITEEIRTLQWRLVRLLRQVGHPAMADEQLYQIARLGPDLQPTAESVNGEQSAAKAVALFELAGRRMSKDTLKDSFELCYDAYKMYSADENTEQYRLTYALIALATNAKDYAARVRAHSLGDLGSPAPYKANNAQVLLAFDAAIHAQPHLLLTTPALADTYSAYAHDALRLALAVNVARQIKTRGDEAERQAEAFLAEAAKSTCPGVAGMAPAIGLLVKAIGADRVAAASAGDPTAKAAAATTKAAWLAQGGLPETIDPTAPQPPPAPAPAAAPAATDLP